MLRYGLFQESISIVKRRSGFSVLKSIRNLIYFVEQSADNTEKVLLNTRDFVNLNRLINLLISHQSS